LRVTSPVLFRSARIHARETEAIVIFAVPVFLSLVGDPALPHGLVALPL